MKIIVFSGTSEGKEIAEYLSSKGIDTTICVATEYGSYVMEDMPHVNISVGRLEKDEMLNLVQKADMVIDATHPYAVLVTENVRAACAEAETEYIRLLREDSPAENVIFVNNIDEAVSLLKNTRGKIFVSTGSKELNKYAALDNYRQRLIVRVLPVKESEDKCISLGLENVIYKKGPFTYKENIEEFKACRAKWLVTKCTGKAGGFNEKINAAKDLGVNVIVIKRPQEKGLSMAEVKKIIDKRTRML